MSHGAKPSERVNDLFKQYQKAKPVDQATAAA
jgi:ribosomal protein S16